MLEVDFEARQPTAAEVSSISWSDVFLPEQTEFAAATDLVEVLSTGREVEAFFVAARVAHHPAVAWFASRNRFREIGFVEHFVGSAVFQRDAPGVAELSRPSFSGPHMSAPFTLGGEIAAHLVLSGAADAQRAVAVASAFSDELIGMRFEEVEVFTSSEAWSEWFNKTPWDRTWIGVDKRECRVWALVVTAPWP